jgi:hypothetical protein
MADFLNRLAARTFGAIPLAEPVIPTRFSSGTEPAASFASDSPFQPTRPFPEISEERPNPLHIREAEPYPRPQTHADYPSPLSQNLDEAPHLDPSLHPRALHPQDPQPSHAELETVQPSPEHTQLHKPRPAATMPLKPIDPSPGVVGETTARNPQTTPPAPAAFAEPKPAPRLTPLTESMRSPTLQQPAFRPASPTVRVSIGRIEVRAEIASPVPTAPAQRPRPSTLSLDQFLKQVGGSAR